MSTYPYSVRSGSGEILSQHRLLIGALDALATIRARAERDGVQGIEYIYDERAGSVTTPPETTEPDGESSVLLVDVGTRGKARLREIAGEVGALAAAGKTVGEPSIQQMLRQIVGGELVVRREP